MLTTRLWGAAMAALIGTPTSFFRGSPPEVPVVRVTLAASAAQAPASGRLLVFLSSTPPAEGQILAPGVDPEAVWISAREVEGLAPGQSVEVNLDSLAFPRAFSLAGAGRRYLQVVLDVDHDFGYFGPHDGDLVSQVIALDSLGTRTRPTAVTLGRSIPAWVAPVDSSITLVSFESRLLSAFWGRRVVINAAVAMPRAPAPPGARYRAIYHLPGWSADHRIVYHGRRLLNRLQSEERNAVNVFMDASWGSGNHVFANSANNGPWGDALVYELIPYLEQRFSLESRPEARFLMGHSSGGWASLWLQMSYPDFFGGAWASSPDPVDFSRFFPGLSVATGSRGNLYRRADGTPVPMMRDSGRVVMTVRQAAEQEAVMAPRNGQFYSFEAVFSPLGSDGRPAPLFDRATGEQDPSVQRAWERFDIVRVLGERWPELGPKLRGKLHILVGGADTYYLDEPTSSLCTFLESHHAEATCEVVPGRNHFDLPSPAPSYPDGMFVRFSREMQARYDSTEAVRR